ncbi:MAG: type II toxin-antitoxin system HicA family toxin [Thiobacillus sp.]
MPKLPHVSGAAVVRALARPGFEKIRQSGSHVVMRRCSKGVSFPCIARSRLTPWRTSCARLM